MVTDARDFRDVGRGVVHRLPESGAAYDRGVLLIDPPAWPAHGRLWSHLVSDTSYAELHDFAARAGLPRRGFEGDHYDVPQELHDVVVAAGAVPTEGRELLRRLQHSGLRISKRRHERVVMSTPEAPWLPAGGRADVIASRQDDPPPNTVLVRLAVTGPAGLLVRRRADGGADLPTRAVGDGSPATALRFLVSDVTGSADGGRTDPRHIGYVRNVVRMPVADYAWPTPFACFAVHALSLHESERLASGEWIAVQDTAAELDRRHWWPIVALHLGLLTVDSAHD